MNLDAKTYNKLLDKVYLELSALGLEAYVSRHDILQLILETRLRRRSGKKKHKQLFKHEVIDAIRRELGTITSSRANVILGSINLEKMPSLEFKPLPSATAKKKLNKKLANKKLKRQVLTLNKTTYYKNIYGKLVKLVQNKF